MLLVIAGERESAIEKGRDNRRKREREGDHRHKVSQITKITGSKRVVIDRQT
jgi:hypothetical protein